jgi:CheY-like chemotaxis protein
MKILVVDDSQAEIRLLQSVLQQGGFHSVATSDPTKVEEKIEEERPNVILLDVVIQEPGNVREDSGDSGDVEDGAQRSLLGRAAGRQRLRRETIYGG